MILTKIMRGRVAKVKQAVPKSRSVSPS